MPRTTRDTLAHVDELAKRFADYAPRESDRRDPAALAALRAAVVARACAERQVVDGVLGASPAWGALVHYRL